MKSQIKMNIEEIKALTQEEKETLLTELAVKVDYTGISILPAPDKIVTDEHMIEDMICLFQSILNGDEMPLIFTTEGKELSDVKSTSTQISEDKLKILKQIYDEHKKNALQEKKS
jgi:hypothetical protein